MKYKQKSVLLSKAKLIAHPQLIALAKNDVADLKVNQCISELLIEVIRTLLDLHPLKCTFSIFSKAQSNIN